MSDLVLLVDFDGFADPVALSTGDCFAAAQLFDTDHFGVDEIADAMGISEGLARNAVLRGRRVDSAAR